MIVLWQLIACPRDSGPSSYFSLNIWRDVIWKDETSIKSMSYRSSTTIILLSSSIRTTSSVSSNRSYITSPLIYLAFCTNLFKLRQANYFAYLAFAALIKFSFFFSKIFLFEYAIKALSDESWRLRLWISLNLSRYRIWMSATCFMRSRVRLSFKQCYRNPNLL